jgi:hypothetical protein
MYRLHSIRNRLRGSEHLLDLSNGPGMFRPGAAMVDGVLSAGISKLMNPEKLEAVVRSLPRLGSSGLLSTKCVAIIGEHGVDRVGNHAIKVLRKSAEICRVARW